MLSYTSLIPIEFFTNKGIAGDVKNNYTVSQKYLVFIIKITTIFCKKPAINFSAVIIKIYVKRFRKFNWDQQKAIFYTEKNVIIHKPDEKIYGTGLMADQDFKNITIKKVHDSYLDIPDSSFLGN